MNSLQEAQENPLHTQIQYRLVEALATSETRHQNLLDNISEIVFTLNADLTFSFLNKAWENHSGYAIKACLEQSIKNFMTASEYQQLLRWTLIKSVVPLKFEVNLICSDGGLRWFQMNLNQETDNNQPCFSGTLINIQQSKTAAQALQIEEHRFKTVVETVSEILFQMDQNYLITFINQAWTQLTGYSAAETLGKPLLEFIHPEDQNYYLLVLDCIAKENKIIPMEFRLTCSKGALLWMSMQAQKNQSIGHGQKWFLTGAMLNITERMAMEMALRKSEERYALMASSTTDGIWDWNLETDEVYLSPRWKSMLGYEDNEIKNSFASWHQRVHPDDIQMAMDELMHCIEGNCHFFENIHRLKHKDGSWRWILNRGITEQNESGLPNRMLGSFTDISLLKQTQDKLKLREQELEAIFSISPDGIVTVTQQGFIQSINPAFLTITGLKREHLVNLSEQAFNNYLDQQCNKPPKHQDANQTLYVFDFNERLFETLPQDTTDTPHRQLKKSLAIKRTDRQINNSSLSKVLYFRDITVETEIAEIKSEFLATAAHELRTPMASVFGFSELLLSRDFDRDTTREILTTIHQQSASLVNILNELLDLARIESRAGMDFIFTEQSLLSIVNRAVNELLVPGDERRIKRRNMKADYVVFVDADKIRQVITNVLSNAYKYSTTGDIVLSVKQRNTGPQAEVGIAIRDQGMGLDEEQQKHIFTRFWRANNTGNIPGTGLGMSLVKDIMELHQGQVEISSKAGIGTTVTLWLKQQLSNDIKP